MRLLPEEERLETLAILAKNKVDVERALQVRGRAGLVGSAKFWKGGWERTLQVKGVPTRGRPGCGNCGNWAMTAQWQLACARRARVHAPTRAGATRRATQGLPLRIETPSAIRRKEDLERRLAEIEDATKIFSRPKVLVHS